MRRAPIVAALAASAALAGGYGALGGGRFKPTPASDPCVAREWRNPQGTQALTEQILLTALDGAACELKVGRENLVLALRSEAERAAFARTHHLSDQKVESAVRDGMRRALAEARSHDALSPRLASLFEGIINRVPITTLVDLVATITD